MRQKITNGVFPTLLPQIAKNAGVPKENIINFFTLMGGKNLTKPELFPDFIHSNDKGYHFMAEEIYLAVAEKIIN